LFHQKKDGTFEDVTEKAGLQGVGYGMGVAVGDYDNDGFEDLYVTAYGGNKLYHNNGDGTFTDVTGRAGVAGSGWSTSAAWVDVDGDGLLDLVVLRYLQWDFDDLYCGEHREGYRSYCHPDSFRPIAPLVYHNDGNGHFTEIAQKVGLALPGKGLGIASAAPLYVIKLDALSRRVVVGPREALRTMRMRLRDVNWLGEGDIADRPGHKGREVFVKVRSTRPPQPGWLVVAPDGVEIELLDGEEGVAPGQACVLYDAADGQSRVLGGGFIKSVAASPDLMAPAAPQRAAAGARG